MLAAAIGIAIFFAAFATLVALGFWYVSRPGPILKSVGPGSRPGLQRFVNTPEALGSEAREHFVPFALEFPSAWWLQGGSGSDRSGCFLRVLHESHHGSGRNEYTELHESIEVRWYRAGSLPSPEAARRILAEVRRLDAFRVVREGATLVAGQPAYELLIESHERDNRSSNPNRLGRLILLPPIGRDGLVVFLEAGPAGGITSAEGVGTTGELVAVMASLVVGGGDSATTRR
jgi:hypothetical protein